MTSFFLTGMVYTVSCLTAVAAGNGTKIPLNGNSGKGVLHIFEPADSTDNGNAIILIPGGRYARLAIRNEGYEWTSYLNDMGFTAAILEYTMPDGNPLKPLDDAADAVRLLRNGNNASVRRAFNNVGVFGFSAGGHLASMLSETDDSISRPDFVALFYPVISMDKNVTHLPSHDNLIGKDADGKTEKAYSTEKNVKENMPHIFIAASSDDRNVSPVNSLLFCKALIEHGFTPTMHLYPAGRHGWGFSRSFKYHDVMLDDLGTWLKDISVR